MSRHLAEPTMRTLFREASIEAAHDPSAYPKMLRRALEVLDEHERLEDHQLDGDASDVGADDEEPEGVVIPFRIDPRD